MKPTLRALLCLAIATSSAWADKDPPELKAQTGVTLVDSIKVPGGYIDDAFAFDRAGSKLALVKVPHQGAAELDELDVAAKDAVLHTFNLTPVTTNPRDVHITRNGQQVFVSGRAAPDAKPEAWLLDWTGKVVHKWGPATDVALSETPDGEMVATYNEQPNDKGGVTYDIAVSGMASGAPRGKASFVAGPDGMIDAQEMSVLYWKNGYTQLVGRKKGGYDRARDQRMNDSQGVYDVIKGGLQKNSPIGNVIAWTRLMPVRAAHPNQTEFVQLTEDLKTLELITADDRRIALATAEPLDIYDLKSLTFEPSVGNKLYFSLTTDPYTADAIEHHRRDLELVDLYMIDLAAADPSKITRVARLAKLDRGLVWHVAGGHLAVLRKQNAAVRGGSTLDLYDLAHI